MSVNKYLPFVPATNPRNPTGLFDLVDMEDRALSKMLRREGFLALFPFILLAAGSFIALHRLPAGKAFVLESRGIGIFYDVMSALTLFLIFGFVYMAPSLWVRRWLSIIYRVTFFLIFTIGLCWLEGERFIAVVQTDHSFIFIRRFTLGHIEIPAASITSTSIRKTSAIAALTIETESRRGVPNGRLECQRVWLKDKRTMVVMVELVRALTEARDDSHKAVAPATAER